MMKEAAEEKIPKKETTMRRDDISRESIELIEKRETLIKQENFEEASEITKQLRKQRKKDKRKASTEALNKEIDIRDRWLGLRQMKKGYQIHTYAIKDKEGNRIKKENIAEEIAKHLAENIWKNEEAEK